VDDLDVNNLLQILLNFKFIRLTCRFVKTTLFDSRISQNGFIAIVKSWSQYFTRDNDSFNV